MATIAFDGSDEDDAPRLPVSLHPAFPAVVALWFAALLGIGTMVLPVVLLERIVDISGISALVPAASPPLGVTARSLIALAAAVVGALGGLAIARRVAGTHNGESPSLADRFASGARRPISINEELGGEALVNGRGLPVDNRRAQAIADDDLASDCLYMAPLPDNYADDLAADFDPGPLEPGAAADDAGGFEDPTEDEAMVFDEQFQLSPIETPALPDRQEFCVQPREVNAEPLPFSPPSLARRETQPDTGSAGPSPAPMSLEAVPAALEPESVRRDWSAAPVDETGLVQLVHRLGASIERRRERLASATPAPPHAPSADFDAAPAEEAAQAMAAYFGKPAAAQTVEEKGATADSAAVEHEPDFGSVLDMRGPFGTKAGGFARLDRPEANDPPGAPDFAAAMVPQSAPADTDAALRAALATLQRMSGTA